MSLIAELKRRNVFKAALLYLVAGWLILQLTDALFDQIGLTGWAYRFVSGLLVICFPLALLLSWVFEITPDGIRRKSDVVEGESVTQPTGRRVNSLIAILLALAVVFFAGSRLIPENGSAAESTGLASGMAATTRTPAPPALEPVRNLFLVCLDTIESGVFFSPLIEDELSARLKTAQQYRNAQSVAPWTVPAIGTVFTGLYPVQHRAGEFPRTVANLETDVPSTLDPSQLTLAELLAGQGFRTAAFAGHGWLQLETGLEQGFQRVRSVAGRHGVIQRFETWLDGLKDTDQRLFGYLHLMEAHDWHLQERSELDARLAAVDTDLRDRLMADASGAACRDRNSDICVRNLVYNLGVRDGREAVAAILDVLAGRDLLQDSLVVVFSDHGEEFWQHRDEHEARGDPRETYGFGHGHSLYQELLHVPLLVWHPGAAGAIHADLVSLVDLFPSLLGWLGMDSPLADPPGSELPTGRQPLHSAAGERVVFASGIAYGPQGIAAFSGPNKSIMYLPDGSFQYFDLASDPLEKSPILSDSLVLAFDVLTGDYLALSSGRAGASTRVNQQQLERLQSIGYLQGLEEADTGDAEQSQKKSDPD